MILFHVQRLSGGFVLSVVVAVVGLTAFCIRRSVASGFVFVAYLFAISTYLYLLGKPAILPRVPLVADLPVFPRHHGHDAPTRQPLDVGTHCPLANHPPALHLAHSV